MDNTNQHHKFNSQNGISANYSLESNTNNGHHYFTQNIVEEEENISPEEEQWLAGYNPNATGLISEEYRLQQDEEKAIERPLTEKPSVRLIFVVGLVGMVIGSASLLWFGFLQPKPPVKQAVKTNNSLPTSEPILDESAELKSRLAFQDQQQQLQAELVSTPSPSQTPQPKPTPSVRPVRQTVPPRTTAVRVAEPAPVIRRNPAPISFNSPIKYTPPQIKQSVEKPESLADTLKQWKQLASLGESQISNSTQEKVTPNNQGSKTLKPGIPVLKLKETELETVLIGSKNVDSQADLTPGMMGILNRTPVDLINVNAGSNKDVALGTSASAKEIMPMIWDEGGNNPNDRFAVELTKPLKATDGTVALPAGTVVVAQTTAVGKKNNLVSATGIALVYPNSQGTVKQETIPANTLLIRGGNKRPLIAQKLHDAGSDIAKQDLLVGLLSSLGRVGSIVNQPRTQSSTVVSGGNFNQSTITTNADPQIWAAALEGFFSPVSQRLSRRSDQAVQELLQRPNIQYLPEGMEVSVVVNNFLKVAR
jgi:Bacterial conjugation TrbI-like protein